MPCFGPLAAYYGKHVNAATGRRSLVFKEQEAHTGVKMLIPCGRCTGCRLERSRQWAMRCMHEKRMHKDSSFLTLTYDDEHMTDDFGLRIDDLQKFMKRLRHVTGDGLRFYACGEYGDISRRPHYHVLLFNFDFDDKRLYSRKSQSGRELYTSAKLAEIWKRGLCVIGNVDFDSCAYVARYIMKKAIGKEQVDFALYDWSTGVVREPEFTVMSRNPGLGTGYYQKFAHEIYRHDSVIVNGREMRPPRFYDLKYSEANYYRLLEVKEARRRLALSKPRTEGSTRRLRVREVVAEAKLRQKGRVL